ncbi:MAG: DUF6525 family protein [Paracoccaceae bacterium]|nr:DUF6525 family protein [Paracoccaceae bacterium]
MSRQHARNIGQTSLRRKRRVVNPMNEYDTLPTPLRAWLGQATLPWSPASARRVWAKTKAKGQTIEEALSTLSKAEAKTLSRDSFALRPLQKTQT